ncbi:MAG TPA: hypothetical protein VNO43_05540 [Candidatus Eisenbacteria bacterium]|nr:hypothetical protein [Candidatus Eisenbacteria bacterium]
MERHHSGQVIGRGHRLRRHDAAVHGVNHIGAKPERSIAYSSSQPQVAFHSGGKTINKQDAHLQADPTKTLDLLFHEHASFGRIGRRIHIGHGEKAHQNNISTQRQGS